MKIIDNKTILITGGTGSLGKALVHEILLNYKPKAIRILSRDELKQWEMANQFKKYKNSKLLRFFLGDIRDISRLRRAFDDVDIIIHAAALKQVPAAEYNPMECIKTNILGAQNVIDAAMDCGVKQVIALSTDKAASPVNLYGATKLCLEKLFVAANNAKGKHNIKFSVLRYGNVMASRGSVIPLFLEKKTTGVLPITHPEMTRFNILLNQAVSLVLYALTTAGGGEVFVPKLPSYKILDLAEAIAPNCKIKIVGIRPGEKLHEDMITEHESLNTIEFNNYFVIAPTIPSENIEKMVKKMKGQRVKPGFKYSSGTNAWWLSVKELRKLIEQYHTMNLPI